MTDALPVADNDNYEAPSRKRLPFSFAKRHGVVIEEIGDVDAMVAYKAGVTPATRLVPYAIIWPQ